MTTWNDYKNHIKSIDVDASRDLEESEAIANIVTAIVQQRTQLGLSQRDLASLCGIPQSSIARLETYKTMPNLNTVLRIFHQLGLKLSVTAANRN